MPEDAFKVHGLSDDFLKDKPVFASVAADFVAFVGEDPLVIHNAAFDMGFLNAELARIEGMPHLALERAIDTVRMARQKRSEERRVGKEGFSTGRFRRAPDT